MITLHIQLLFLFCNLAPYIMAFWRRHFMHLIWRTYLEGTLCAPDIKTYLLGTLHAPYMTDILKGTLRAYYMRNLTGGYTSSYLYWGDTSWTSHKGPTLGDPLCTLHDGLTWRRQFVQLTWTTYYRRVRVPRTNGSIENKVWLNVT